MDFTENSRVKIPTVLHLCRLGYTYLPLKGTTWDKATNIFTDIFTESIGRINPGINADEVKRLYVDVALDLENEDLGKAFYERLTARSGVRLIDFENIGNNSWHVVTELPCIKDNEEFRPDITLLVNGMPLVFIEVKKPNNKDGIRAERYRMNRRFGNKKFRRFINVTQLMVFSNNMEYDEGEVEPLQGAFYATIAYDRPAFNYFREEEADHKNLTLPTISDELENFVLKDNNLLSIKHSPEFATNKDPNTPTNRVCTSLMSKERLMFMLRYGLTYVNETKGLEKHVMRYPQIFATKAIVRKLDAGIRKGIIWHTQGSGKTALAYYNVHHLTDYFQQQGVVPKFYFIVDRLDLLTQAKDEFTMRGLKVRTIESKEEFAKEIKSTLAVHNDSGSREITVVNIHKFQDDPDVVRNTDYSLNIQRIYFLDEVHRSYNPKGSFLANLNESDGNAIKIGLTGTPLLGTDFNSRALFGEYIHKYYYNASIRDGYTLRLIREEIINTYRIKLKEILEQLKVLKGEGSRKLVYAHPRFVEPMLDYIVEDFESFRLSFNDSTTGAMVVCDTADQAKEMYAIFQAKYAEVENALPMAAEPPLTYGEQRAEERRVKKAALILHDVGDNDERKRQVNDFKEGRIDILFVYNMLLTGFDAKRLKKLYLGRVVKQHNLLQTLTRVNRTYRDYRFGYVVDFADIQTEFDKTNRAYFNELQAELGDDLEHYSNLFLKPEEIASRVEEIKRTVFAFDTRNAEVFSQQVSEVNDRATMQGIVKALNEAKELYNLIRLTGNYDLLDKLDFRQFSRLASIANDRMAIIQKRETLESGKEMANLLNVALEDVLFAFTKVGESELVLADALKDILRQTREMMAGNFDRQSPEFISMLEELERLFQKKNLNEVTREEMEANMKELQRIYDLAREDDRKNRLLRAKYANDAKYVRMHKRLMEKRDPTDNEELLFKALTDLKQSLDEQVLQNGRLLGNEAYAERMVEQQIVQQLYKRHNLQAADSFGYIKQLLVREYMNEYHGRAA